MQSWYSIRAAAGGDGEICVYDEIGGWGISARQFVDDLQALGAVKSLTVRINSPGGSFFDGVAIYNALARHPAHKTVWVDGFAASAASVVAMAGDEIVMPENTMMVIHEPRGAGAGTAADMRVIAEALDRACRSIVSIYAAKTERSAADVEALLATETWMSAQEAFDLGFADRIEPAVAIAARFDAQKFRVKHLPAAVAALLKAATMPDDEPAAPLQIPADVEADDATAAPVDPPATAEPPPPEAEADAAPTPDEAPVTAPAAAAEARKVALGYAREVTELCALAGFAERAAKFITAETSVEQVREALLEGRAAADARLAVDGTCAPRAGRMPAGNDAGWGDAIARVCKP